MDVMLEHFHFLRLWVFVLLIPLLLLIYQLLKIRHPLGAWEKICDPELLNYLKVGSGSSPASLRFIWLLSIVAVLTITALAGPVWEKLPQPMYQEQSSLVIILDVSRSMDAADLKPSRLTRAKQKIIDVLSLRSEGQSALLVFAGTAYVVTPLTEDSQTILAQLRGISTDIMPQQGGNLDAAFAKVIELFAQSSVVHGQVLLLTDSSSFSVTAVKNLVASGHALSVIGVGTAEGAPIKQGSGGFLTDKAGNIVVPKLDVQQLRRLASLGGGTYSPLTLSNIDILPVLDRNIIQGEHQSVQASSQTSDVWQEEGPWLLLLLIPLVLMGFRRGVLVVVLLCSVQPVSSEAMDWDDWWQTKNQQAQALMKQEAYGSAAEHFTNPAWKATAAYRNQDYSAALQALEGIEQPNADDKYNMGNALAQLGRLDEALKMYDDVLAQSPQHKDAMANKALLEKIGQQQQEEKQQQEVGEDGSEQSQSSAEDSSPQGKPSSDDAGGSDSQDDASEEGSSEAARKLADKQQDKAEEHNPDAKADREAHADKQSAEQVQASHQEDADAENIEMSQAFEQQLRRIPDDPAGLLRRKFLYQYQQQQERAGQEQDTNLW